MAGLNGLLGAGEQAGRRWSAIAAPLLSLAVLVLATASLLFFLLRLSGDPALVIAGGEPTPAQLDAIRAEYGFDRSLWVQYLAFLADLVRLDFGLSFASGRPALDVVLDAFPATVLLGALGMGLTLLVGIPLGLWLGMNPQARARRIVRGIVFCLQGVPGFIVALLLVQVFAIQLVWLPALGRAGAQTWILPAVSIMTFMAPTLARLLEANTQVAAASPYVLTARATGASELGIAVREVARNALLGTLGYIGAQVAFLMTGLVVLESIFAWPGIGWLLVQSTTNLDFPVVQAAVLLIVLVIAMVTALTRLAQRWLDPRIGGAHG
ncbi:ABC transporter permease [Novosphingobium sp. YJ-S2-02]|uniref:ABC transporter permease n=1 Tax=Novosphingobium aureum TaxID=2792964 RepID=A0A931MLV1_9SPHN|nr:ABC transporter permease [Novosphingobium aureum]MBH0114457.1 ABC transporter permease [Novosphingobium aureum]